MYRMPTNIVPHANKSITVYGSGLIQVVPQVSRITIGIITENTDLSIAQKENAVIQQKLVNNLVNDGILRNNIQTVDYTIFPQYDYIDNNQVFKGYQVKHMLSILVEDFNLTGPIVDLAVQSGANQVTNIEFDVSNRNALYQQALQKAMENALMKAQAIAQTFPSKLDPVPKKVSELPSNNTPIPLAKTQMNQFSTSIEGGQLTVEANLEVVFYLSP